MSKVVFRGDRGSRAAYLADMDLVVRTVVASTLIGSALIHGTVASEHFGEWVWAGVFFVALQVVEVGLALLAIYSWADRAAILVIVTGILTVSVWVLSRTRGMPVGPADLRVPEAVGVPDLACGLLELFSVAAAAAVVVSARLSAGSAPTWTGSGGERTRRGVVIAGGVVVAATAVTIWGGAPTVLASGTGHHDRAVAAAPAR